jgi:hypothetical protein
LGRVKMPRNLLGANIYIYTPLRSRRCRGLMLHKAGTKTKGVYSWNFLGRSIPCKCWHYVMMYSFYCSPSFYFNLTSSISLQRLVDLLHQNSSQSKNLPWETSDFCWWQRLFLKIRLLWV